MADAYAKREATIEFEYRVLHPVKDLRHVETRNRATYDDSSSPVDSIGVVMDVTERRSIEARVAHLAHHDPLTGLANRGLFRVRLDEALARAEQGEPFALLCLDLDRFKEINDTLGHPIGDTLLQAVSMRLSALVREFDTVARLGGDEFAVIQRGLHRTEESAALAGRFIAALHAPLDLNSKHFLIGASISIAVAPDDGMDAQTLLTRADVALYTAKAEGRGCHRRFQPHMDADLQTRRALEFDLRQALERGEFELFYQPIVNLALRRVCCFEALLRWHHPIGKLVPSDAFIPVAEATRLLVPIGTWALRASLRGGRRLAQRLPGRRQPVGRGVVQRRTGGHRH